MQFTKNQGMAHCQQLLCSAKNLNFRTFHVTLDDVRRGRVTNELIQRDALSWRPFWPSFADNEVPHSTIGRTNIGGYEVDWPVLRRYASFDHRHIFEIVTFDVVAQADEISGSGSNLNTLPSTPTSRAANRVKKPIFVTRSWKYIPSLTCSLSTA
jgi:hypothetical protein